MAAVSTAPWLYRFRQRFAELRGDPFRKLRRRRHRQDASLRDEYLSLAVSRMDDSFGLYRIIGNDLPPRHSDTQTLDNLRFILEHEPVLEQCKKHWVINRIHDPCKLDRIVELLEDFGQHYDIIPFDSAEYRRLALDNDCLPDPDYLNSWAYRRLDARARLRLRLAQLRPRILYAMNINGARNFALGAGKARYKWVLPWDGATFLTRLAWADILRKVRGAPHFRYFLVPMTRVTSNSVLLDETFYRPPQDEPQLIFRNDSRETFDPVLPYGNRNKIELFARLRVPGPWLEFSDDPWDQPRRRISPEEGQFAVAGWVARLSSGTSITLHKQPDRQDMRKIHDLRLQSILDMITRIDADVA